MTTKHVNKLSNVWDDIYDTIKFGEIIGMVNNTGEKVLQKVKYTNKCYFKDFHILYPDKFNILQRNKWCSVPFSLLKFRKFIIPTENKIKGPFCK